MIEGSDRCGGRRWTLRPPLAAEGDAGWGVLVCLAVWRVGSSFDFAQDEPFEIWDEVLSLRAVDGWAAGLNPAS